jgi:hypothetical protein
VRTDHEQGRHALTRFAPRAKPEQLVPAIEALLSV